MFDWFVRIDCELEFFGELSDLRCRTLEIQCKPTSRLRAEHDVFRYGHSLDQHEVLVDHAEAKRNRIVRRFDVANLAVNDNLATVSSVEAIRDAHRCRLPCSIFP